MKNRDIGRKLLKPLNAMPGVKAMKIAGGPFTEEGAPDVLVVARGRCIMVEVKRDERDAPTPMQRLRLRQWQEAGAVTVVATALEDVLAVL